MVSFTKFKQPNDDDAKILKTCTCNDQMSVSGLCMLLNLSSMIWIVLTDPYYSSLQHSRFKFFLSFGNLMICVKKNSIAKTLTLTIMRISDFMYLLIKLNRAIRAKMGAFWKQNFDNWYEQNKSSYFLFESLTKRSHINTSKKRYSIRMAE